MEFPRELFQEERLGAFRVGDSWLEGAELFMFVMRNGGIGKVSTLPYDSPIWLPLLTAKAIPNPLPTPIQIPKTKNTTPDTLPTTTTSPVEYIVKAYQAWFAGFEAHWQRQKQMAAMAKQQAQANPPTPQPTTPQAPTPTSAPLPSPAPTQVSLSQHDSPATPGPSALPGKISSSRGRSKDAQSPIVTDGPPGTDYGGEKKRKRSRSKHRDPAEEPASTPLPKSEPEPEPEPLIPKRARYKVEYRPLHHPPSVLGGWDERAVASSFLKSNLTRPSRSVHELGIVDMEAVLMGLRSRLPHELGYTLTVLSMLSMPHPEENIGGLPLHHLAEVYLEIIELIGEAAFGEDAKPKTGWETDGGSSRGTSLNRLTSIELERLGRDVDFTRPDEPSRGQTDIVLTCLNVLRNFSMLPDNQALMARFSALFVLLATITDGQLCRIPIDDSTLDRPFSILEMARIRRDAVVILTNIGTHVDLRTVPFESTSSVFRLLASFLCSSWETILSTEDMFGPFPSPRDVPPHTNLSLVRALEAFSKLAFNDLNREILSRIPSDQLVALYESLIKLLPINERQYEAIHTLEDSLAYTECLALSLYSLVFLSPLPTRALMRSVPGSATIISRLVFDSISRGYDYKQNTFAILARRLLETLGVLNGNVCPMGQETETDTETKMSFSAGGSKHGWKFGSSVVVKGWLADKEERIMETMMTRGIDAPAFGELDNLWIVGQE
ncbi:hypothetical protein P7C73_g4599, partial [Tremellales sp. Uapishka_1]